MRSSLFALAVASALITTTPATAQREFDAVTIRTEQLAPGLAVLFGSGGNIAVSHGADGTVVVDDQFAELTARIQAAIAALGAPPAKFLINTHWHGDHSGGNANFSRSGAIIMAQDHVRDRMSTDQSRDGEVTPPSPAAALPVITWHDGITVHLNGQAIRTIHMPHAHTDGDSIVWFREANVVHMGDLFLHRVSLPYIDLGSGGNALGVLAAVERVLGMTNETTRFIPGHGPVASRADLTAYRDMLKTVIERVRAERAAGKTLEQIVAMKPAAAFEPDPPGFINGDSFVTFVYRSLEQPAHAHHAAGHDGHASPAGHEHNHH